jgi:cytochrome c biogenesis protein
LGKEKNKNPGIVRFFCSLKLTISLLIILAVVSIFGTVIPQRLADSQYLKHYPEGLFRIVKFLGVFDLYHAWWFRFLLLLLILNLIFCSLQRFPRAWRFISSPKKWLDKEDFSKHSLSDEFQLSSKKISREEAVSIVSGSLKHAHVTEKEGGVIIFSERGRISRLGVYITHLSVIIILAGALIGSIFGFEAFVSLVEGDTADTVYLRDGLNTPKRLDFAVCCNDFNITLYPNGMVKEYASDLSVFKDGKEIIKNRKIKVNHPLMFEGIRFYQASYEKLKSPLMTISVENAGSSKPVVFKLIGGDEKKLADGSVFSVLQYHPNLQNFGPAVQIMRRRKNGATSNFWIFLKYPGFDIKRGGQYIFTLKNIQELYSTGLQVTKDPGVWVVWLGCLLMVGGLIITFFISHRRVWVGVFEEDNKKIQVFVAGSTNRNLITFETEFQKMIEELRRNLGIKAKKVSA